MSPSRLFLVVVCLFAPALPAFAERPTDSRSGTGSDSRSGAIVDEPRIPREIGGKTYKQWKDELSHDDPSVRANAISVIPGFYKDAMDAVPVLVRRLTRDGDASCRAKAAIALRMMYIRETDRASVITGLGSCIGHDPQAIVRYEAARTLMRFGRLEGDEERKVIGDLVRGLNDTSTWELRHACIWAIIIAGVDIKKGPDDNVTDALLLRLQHEPARQVRLEAVMALGALGRPQKPLVLQRVLGLLKSQNYYYSRDKTIRIWSHVSLMALSEKVDPKDLKTVANYLNDRDRDVRVQAVSALGALEGKAGEHVNDIVYMLRTEKEPPVLIAACNALGRMKNKGERVLNTLMRQTEYEESEMADVVIAACNGLASLRAANAEVLEAMNKALDRKSLTPQQKELVRKAIRDIQKPLSDDDAPKARQGKDVKDLDKGVGGKPRR